MMRRRTLAVAIAFAAALLLGLPMWRAYASGSWTTVTLFEYHVHPDMPLDKFAAGRMGIIKPTWDHSYLYVAYRYLNGSDLNASEQQAMLSLWNEWLGLEQTPEESREWGDRSSDIRRAATTTGNASAEWLAARNKVPGVGIIERISVFRSAPDKFDLFTFANCNESSYRTAANTLDSMIAKFGVASPQVKRWVGAQDQVFDNCSDNEPQYAGNDDPWYGMVDEWTQARGKVPGVDAPTGGFSNGCSGVRFRTAAQTLDSMIVKLGASSPEVKQWVQAQDKAFKDCSSSVVGNSTLPPPPDIPAPVTDGTPFEQAQRNYQIAAATFYGGDYDGAAKLFEAIANDSSSPWQSIAPYLVARAMIRKATLSAATNDSALLAQAEARLNKIVATSDNETVKRDAQQLLDFVAAKLHPDQREEELAHAVMLSTSGEVLKQDVRDYIWMLEHYPSKEVADKDDLTAWIATFGQNITLPPVADPIAKWKTTASLPWLVAAISEAQPSDPDAQALIAAAEKLKPESLAFVTANYHVARVEIGQGKADEARATLDALLAMRDQLPIGTVNELKRLRMTIARNLGEMLVDAPRTTLGFSSDDGEELPATPKPSPATAEAPAPQPTPGAQLFGYFSSRESARLGEGNAAPSPSGIGAAGGISISTPEVAAAPTPAATPEPFEQTIREFTGQPLFDTDAAGALTREPLSGLVVAAQSPILTPYLRGRIALPAFVRALLLGDDTAARVLAPLVADSYPSLKPLIEDWRTAKSLNEKNFAAAFMIIQNPGMRYEIESGPGRLDPLGGVEPLDEIDALRDNWWGIPRSGIGSHPNFISAAESKTADDEWQKLSAINAPNYLCSAAIEHTRSHPDDDRNPRALYRCLTAVHLGCSNDHGTELARSAFQLLHRRYPNSVWSEKGNIWYRGDGCGGT